MSTPEYVLQQMSDEDLLRQLPDDQLLQLLPDETLQQLAQQSQQPQEQPTDYGNEARGVYNRFMKGTTDIGGTILDVLQLAGTGLAQADYNMLNTVPGLTSVLGINPPSPEQIAQAKDFSSAQQLRDIWNQQGYSAEPKAYGGKVIGSIANFIPSLAVPGGKWGPALISTLLAGGAAGVTEAEGGTPTDQLIAALVANPIYGLSKLAARGGGRFLTNIGRMFTEGGRKTIAAGVAQQAAGPEAADLLEAAILKNPNVDDPLRMTAAEMLNAEKANAGAGVARLQMDMAANPLAGAAGTESTAAALIPQEIRAARAAERNALTESLVPMSVREKGVEDLGAITRRTAAQGVEARKREAQGIFKQVEGEAEGVVNTEKAAWETAEELADAFGPPNPPMGRSLNRVVENMAPRTGPKNTRTYDLSFQWVKKLRSNISSLQRLARRRQGVSTPTEQEVRTLTNIKQRLDDAVKEAVAAGEVEGVDAAQWEKASNLWAEAKDLEHESQIASIFKKKPRGRYNMPSSEVPGHVIRTPEAAEDFVTTVSRSPNPERGFSAIRAYVAKELGRTAEGNWTKWIDKREGTLKWFYGNDFPVLRRVAESITRELEVVKQSKAPSYGQSWTRQGNIVTGLRNTLLVAVHGARTLGSLTGLGLGGTGGAIAGLSAGLAVDRLAMSAAADINRLLMEGTWRSPELFLELLRRPTPRALTAVLGDIASNTTKFSTAAAIRTLASQVEDRQELPQPMASAAQAPSMMNLVDALTGVKPAYGLPTGNQPEENVMGREDISDALLSAVAQVESNKNPNAVSPKGAQGMYQIMPKTGKAYGLKDPFNAEEAREVARSILGDEFDRFGSLELALAAYNAGAPRVRRAIKQAGDDTDWELIKAFLPPETRMYVPKVLRKMEG